MNTNDTTSPTGRVNPRTEVLNTRLVAFDSLMQAGDLTPEEQVSVAMLAVILATRRVFTKLGINGHSHGTRRKIIRKAIESDFAKKLMVMTIPRVDTLANDEPAATAQG